VTARRWSLIAVVLGSGIVFLDSTIVPVALPEIGRELSSSLFKTLEAQSYIYYGYLLSLSALLILSGALSDYFGRKRLFMIGLLGFGATSLLCGVAPTMDFLIVARILQGAAGSILVPGSLSIITANFQGEEQGRAFGIWAGASGATTIFGPVLGGALITYVSWRTVFLINVPLVVFGLWATSRFVVESRDEDASGQFDWLGAAVAAAAIAGLTFGPIRGQAEEWRESSAYIALAVGVAATVAFPILMTRARHPLVPLDLFRSRNFSVTNVSTFLIYGPIYVTIQLLALFAIGVLGYNEIGFGAATIPSTLFLALFSTRFGSLADRYGPRIFMSVGPVLMGVGLLWLTRIPATSSPWRLEVGDPSTWFPSRGYMTDVLPSQVLFGIGLMVMVAPLTTALMRSVPVHNSGVASAFNNAVSRVAPQVVGALLFIAISATFYADLGDRVPRLDTSSEQLREDVSPLNPVAPEADDRVADAARESSTDSLRMAMLVLALSCFAGGVVNAAGISSGPAGEALRDDKAITSRPPSTEASRSLN
jgi:EmrB/QacA subfamily drug resistance transporter